ncbi:hypothetical protein HMI55_003152 [Coelomomyces lativittatus]|nr:hypothetical protein HMI55_003152 [Coelomomyces lativittatus]
MFRKKSDTSSKRSSLRDGSKSSLNNGSNGSIAESSLSSKNSIVSSDPTSISTLDIYTPDPSSLRLLPKKKTKSSISTSILESPKTLEKVLSKKIQKINKLDDQNLLAPLHYLAMQSNEESLQTFIRIAEKQINFLLVDGYNRTALMHACLANNLDLLTILLPKSEAILDHIDKFGYTCIHYAIAMGNAQAVRYLVEKKVGLHLLINGDSYLHVSLRLNKPEVALILIQNGIDVNLKDSMERSPLHLACELELENVCKELLSHGADPNQRDMFQKYPADYLGMNVYLKKLFQDSNELQPQLDNPEKNCNGELPNNDLDFTEDSISEDISIEEDLPLPEDDNEGAHLDQVQPEMKPIRSERRVSFSEHPIQILSKLPYTEPNTMENNGLLNANENEMKNNNNGKINKNELNEENAQSPELQSINVRSVFNPVTGTKQTPETTLAKVNDIPNTRSNVSHKPIEVVPSTSASKLQNPQFI